MAKTVSIQRLAELSDLCKHQIDDSRNLEVSYRKGRKIGVLKSLTWARGSSGRPTRRIIECDDGGKVCHFDKNYEVEPTALRFIASSGSSEEIGAPLMWIFLDSPATRR